MLRVPAFATLIIVALCAVLAAFAAGFYKWTDGEGVTHFATSLEDVPEKYRPQVTTREYDEGPAEADPSIADRPANEAAASTNASSPDDTGTQLKRFEVPYQAYEGSARRVIVSMTFNGGVTAPMALDTGSPGMIISYELAARLGLFSRDNGALLTEAAGIGGAQTAILTIVDSVSIGDARDTFVPTTVTSSLSDAFQGLIGMDFVTNYTISINSKKKVLVFQETEPNPNSRGGHDEAWWRTTFEEFSSARDYWSERAAALSSRSGSKTADFVEFQAREAERLMQRLDGYASDNAVPRHWR